MPCDSSWPGAGAGGFSEDKLSQISAEGEGRQADVEGEAVHLLFPSTDTYGALPRTRHCARCGGERRGWATWPLPSHRFWFGIQLYLHHCSAGNPESLICLLEASVSPSVKWGAG